MKRRKKIDVKRTMRRIAYRSGIAQYNLIQGRDRPFYWIDNSFQKEGGRTTRRYERQHG